MNINVCELCISLGEIWDERKVNFGFDYDLFLKSWIEHELSGYFFLKFLLKRIFLKASRRKLRGEGQVLKK